MPSAASLLTKAQSSKVITHPICLDGLTSKRRYRFIFERRRQRDLPERFGPWNTVFTWFDRRAKDGTWRKILTTVQARSDQLGNLHWVVSVESTIARVHQHSWCLSPASEGTELNHTILGPVASEYAIGKLRGRSTCKIHLVVDGRGRHCDVLARSTP
jgi:hypothetical protein